MSLQDLRTRLDQLKENERKQAIINEETKKGQLGERLLDFGTKAIPAGVAAYLTSGVLPAILPGGTTVAAAGPATAAGVGATADIGLPAAIGANLTKPTASTIMAALEGVTKGAEAKTPEEAGLAGFKAGVAPSMDKFELDKMKDFGLIPSTAKRGEINYGKPGLTLADVQGLSIPSGLQPTYTLGKSGASVKLAPIPKKTTSTTFKPSQELFEIVNGYMVAGKAPTAEDKAEMQQRYSPQEFNWVMSKFKESIAPIVLK
jgi:hypothetical protein